MDAYVVSTSSLNDKHTVAASFSSLVLLSSSVSMANLSCLPATTFSLGSLQLIVIISLQSFESGQALLFVVFYFHICVSYPLSLSVLSSSVSDALFALSFSFLSERFFFILAKAALAYTCSRN